MVIGMKKRMDDRAISDAELMKYNDSQDIGDEREGKVRDGLKFLGWELEWVAMPLQRMRR